MALAELDIHIANSINYDLYSLSLNLENTFPRVWQHLIIRFLHECGLRGLLPRLIERCLHDRTFQFRVANHLSSPHISPVPQGSPLIGILFLIAINEIFSIIYSFKPILFVDDLSINLQSNDPHRAHRILQTVMSSTLLGFSAMASASPSLNLHCHSSRILFTYIVKFLSLLFHSCHS